MSIKIKAILLFIFVACLSSVLPNLSAHQNKVCFHGSCVVVEVAQTEAELTRGLQSRESLKEENGMLFVFPRKDTYRFWMKDTLIALDIVWLDENRKVVYVASDVLPCHEDPCPTYGPAQEARYVLEINAGLAKRLGINTGDEARFEINP